MAYGKPEQICPHERPGCRKNQKRKARKALRRILKTAEEGGRVHLQYRGYST